MTTVDKISEKAAIVLAELGVDIKYGYGDVYHFTGVPGLHAGGSDIPETFAIRGIKFAVDRGVLKLTSEVVVNPTPEQELHRLIKLLGSTEPIVQEDRAAILRWLRKVQ